MSDFLPNDYEAPTSGSDNYMKFIDGANKFRILANPVLGWEYWADKKVMRKPLEKPFTGSQVQDPSKIKHFWAMPVWNYTANKVQVLVITQKGIQKSLTALAKDTDWGSPLTYDIVVTRTGEGMDTEYQVQPKPAKKLEAEIAKKFKEVTVNLNALFVGGDPFKDENKSQAEFEKQMDGANESVDDIGF